MRMVGRKNKWHKRRKRDVSSRKQRAWRYYSET
jgi:hypothetical protein